MSTNDDSPPRQPRTDTWGWEQDGAAWHTELVQPAGMSRTQWWRSFVEAWLEDFSPLTRVTEATLTNDDPRTIVWSDGAYTAFRERLLAAIVDASHDIVSLTLSLDLHAWFRVGDSMIPERAWLRWSDVELYALIDPETNTGYATFELPLSLFAARSRARGDNHALHALNQPLLADALERWARRPGVKLSWSGELPGMYERGFLPDDEE